jgi:hypothetical protein
MGRTSTPVSPVSHNWQEPNDEACRSQLKTIRELIQNVESHKCKWFPLSFLPGTQVEILQFKPGSNLQERCGRSADPVALESVTFESGSRWREIIARNKSVFPLLSTGFVVPFVNRLILALIFWGVAEELFVLNKLQEQLRYRGLFLLSRSH